MMTIVTAQCNAQETEGQLQSLSRTYQLRVKLSCSCIKYIKRPTVHFGFMSVFLLHSGHQHVSGTHVTTFRVVRTRTKAQLKYV